MLTNKILEPLPDDVEFKEATMPSPPVSVTSKLRVLIAWLIAILPVGPKLTDPAPTAPIVLLIAKDEPSHNKYWLLLPVKNWSAV